jgi:hypothetical protein
LRQRGPPGPPCGVRAQRKAKAQTKPICGLFFDLHAPWNTVELAGASEMQANPRGAPEILCWNPGERRLMTPRMYLVADGQLYWATSA